MSPARASPADVARSIVFAVVFYTVTAAAVLIAPIVALFGRGTIRGYGDGWIRFHGWATRVLLGIVPRVEGETTPGIRLYAAKHQSMYETMELVAILGGPAVLVKRELAQIPLWGWAAMRWGVIPVDRAGSAAALRAMLREAEVAMGEGRSLLIFPEGTRVAVGESPPLRSGFAGLYRLLKAEVVPVALDAGRLWPRQSFIKRAGTVTFRFGAPVPPGLPRREAEGRVHAAINALETDPAP